jgi:tetratricopeptide (TPR) repeat protein
MGNTLLSLGRPREAQQCFERALQSLVAPEDQRSAFFYHSDYRAMARAMLARALWLQGFAERAHNEAKASLDELGATDHQISICRVLNFGICRIATMTGDFVTADRAIARLIEVSTRLNASFWQMAGGFLEGKLLVERREFAEGLRALRGAFETCSRTGWRFSEPEFKGALAEAFAGLGQLGEALDAVDDAVTSAGQRDGQAWYLPELLRIKGEVLLQQAADRSASAAEDCFNQAREMALEQGALFWGLRVALSLARLRVRTALFATRPKLRSRRPSDPPAIVQPGFLRTVWQTRDRQFSKRWCFRPRSQSIERANVGASGLRGSRRSGTGVVRSSRKLSTGRAGKALCRRRCAPPLASLGSGPTKVERERRVTSSRRFLTGSVKDSRRLISKRRRR